MPDLLNDIPTNAFLFGGALLVSLVAFVFLIFIPAMKSFGRWPERIAAGFLAIFIFGTLVTSINVTHHTSTRVIGEYAFEFLGR